MTENPEECGHITLLTPRPTKSEAITQACRLRRVPMPHFLAGFWGEHPRLGRFKISEDDCDHVEWCLNGEDPQIASLRDLSLDHSKASQRLGLGWLISALHELEGIHIAEGIPDPNEAMKEIARWQQKAKPFFRWAIAPVDKIELRGS